MGGNYVVVIAAQAAPQPGLSFHLLTGFVAFLPRLLFCTIVAPRCLFGDGNGSLGTIVSWLEIVLVPKSNS